MSIRQYIYNFLHELSLKNYSPATIELRKGALVYFADWLKTKSVQGIVREEIETYLVHIHQKKNVHGRGISPSRKQAYLVSLKLFLVWLYTSGHSLYDMSKWVILPKLPRLLPKNILEEKEVLRVINEPNTNRVLGIRNRCLLELLYTNGIRVKELSYLKVNDLDLEHGICHVREGKGRKERLLPLGESSVYWLKKYISLRFLIQREYCSYLFLSQRTGLRLKANSITSCVRDILNRSGIDKYGACHLFRHSVATHMLARGASIRAIQELLGHARLSSTEIYIHLNIKELKDAYERFKPI